MTLQRGDLVLVQFPFSSGLGGKKRPALVIQNDYNNQRITNTILAAITSTTRPTHESTQLLIEVNTPGGRQSGLLFDSAITCENLATVEQRLIQRKIGTLPALMMVQINQCFRESLGL